MKAKKEISISQNIVNKEGGVVILSLREYQKLCAKAVPTYYLEGKEQDHFIFLTGAKYRKYLAPHLSSFDVPMEGMPIGKQLQYLRG